MSQVDKILVDNGSGRSVRMGFNHLIEAVADHFSGPKAPGFTFAGMFWRDTSKSPAILRVRNDANTAWIDFRDMIGLGKRNSPTFVGVNATGNVTATGDVTARNVTATGNVTARNVEVNGHIEMHAPAGAIAHIDMRSDGHSGDYDWRLIADRKTGHFDIRADSSNDPSVLGLDKDGTIYTKKYGTLDTHFAVKSRCQWDGEVIEFATIDGHFPPLANNFPESYSICPAPYVVIGVFLSWGTIRVRGVKLRNN